MYFLRPAWGTWNPTLNKTKPHELLKSLHCKGQSQLAASSVFIIFSPFLGTWVGSGPALTWKQSLASQHHPPLYHTSYNASLPFSWFTLVLIKIFCSGLLRKDERKVNFCWSLEDVLILLWYSGVAPSPSSCSRELWGKPWKMRSFCTPIYPAVPRHAPPRQEVFISSHHGKSLGRRTSRPF